MSPQTILAILLAATAFSYFFEQSLAWLNIARPRQDIDPRVREHYDTERYAKTVSYQKDKTRLALITASLFTAANLLLLAFGTFGWLENQLAASIGSQLPRALAFYGILYLAMDLATLPVQIYATFRLEARYGFNRTTPKLFIADKIKSLILSALLGAAAISGLVTLVQKMGPNFWIWFAAAAILFILLMNMFYTSLIVPLFNKLRPLPEGELRNAIEAYAQTQNFRLTGIYVIDASKRSSKSNAYFSGIGPKKKIVLYDTLIEKHSIEELVAVLAHEVGHYRHKHIIKSFIASAMQISLILWVFSLFAAAPALSLALGADHYALHLNLLAFAILAGPITSFSSLFSMVTSRRYEYQADAFAARTTSAAAMSSALIRLSADNLSYLYPHPAYVFFNYSHPPLLQRLEHLGV